MGKYKSYEKYKDSGVEWLGEIPERWEVKKLKFIADVQPSNVDKKTVDDELPVLLCNYSDVYNNEWITDEIDFMKATATQAEIAKFLINKGDVIITKDSESPNDIAVPALVIQDFENVICGYHLTQIKSKGLNGNFLFRLFQCKRFNAQFVVSANGVTRFGLPQRVVNDAFVGFPPLPEQQAIANFLDYKTKQIDALIAKKETLLEKLNEKRTAIISHAVTKGLDPNVPMKDSGIEWLGEIPEHWEVKRTKFLVTKIGSGKTPKGGSEIYVDSGVMLIRSQNVYDDGLRLDDVVYIDKEIDKIQANSRVFSNDILLNITGASIGRVSLVPSDLGQANVNQHVCIFRPICFKILPEYLHLLLCSKQGKEEIFFYENGTSREGLTFQQAGNLIFPIPQIDEQQQITQYLDKKTTEIDKQKAKIQQAIDRLKEYRTALITNAVTGKIDVRQVPIP